MKKRTILNNLILSGLLASSLIVGGEKEQIAPSEAQERSAKVVREGSLEYNNGPLISHGFLTCTGLIFDYGNSAIMAHALPGTSYRFNSFDGIGSDDVVQQMINLSKAKGLDYHKAKIIINAQNKVSLDTIVNDLKKEGLKPTKIIDYRMKNPKLTSTSSYYNPQSDNLYDRPTKDKDISAADLTEVY